MILKCGCLLSEFFIGEIFLLLFVCLVWSLGELVLELGGEVFGVFWFYGFIVYDFGVEFFGLKVDVIECEFGNDFGSWGGILGFVGELEVFMGSFGFCVLVV